MNATNKSFFIFTGFLYFILLIFFGYVFSTEGLVHRLSEEQLSFINNKDQELFGGKNCENDYQFCGTKYRENTLQVYLIGDSFARQWGYGLFDNFDYQLSHIGLLCTGIDIETSRLNHAHN